MNELQISSEQKILVETMIKSLPNLRKRYGVSQTLLGAKVGLSRQTISSIERGTAPLTWCAFLALMMFFMANNNCVFYFPKRNGYKYTDELMDMLVVSKQDKEPVRILGE